jgi:sugar phosphate isomerase/epimerase
MQYAFMSFSTPELDLEESIRVAERYGYAGLEPRLDAGHAHGIEVSATPAARAAIRERMRTGSVRLACLASSLKFADPAACPQAIAQGHARIDLAGDLGVPALRVFGGVIGRGLAREQAIEGVAAALRALADHAAERQVVLCMETHDDWCDPADVARVMEAADHPAVRVNWDIMHPVRTRQATINEAFETLRPWIGHVHIHDGTGEQVNFVPIGQGEIDHRAALKCLHGMGYAGYLSGEWIGWIPWAEHLPAEIATLRTYEANL